MKSFRDLRVWQQSMKLVETIYRLTKTFPKHETYGLMSQLQRATVCSFQYRGRAHERTLREYLHHISMAQASLAEVETQLELATRLEYVTPSDMNEVQQEINFFGKATLCITEFIAQHLELSNP